MDKVIINVGRQIGSGGRVVAQLLAEEFGARFYDKGILDLAAKESGFSKQIFEKNDERKGFLRAIFQMGGHGGAAAGSYYQNSLSQESLYRFQCDAILSAAAEAGNCVFVGRTADYVLRHDPAAVSVFITADLSDRVAAVAARHNVGEAEAEKMIRTGEDRRASYYNYYTGKRWGHCESYDLTVNASRLGLEETARLVADFIRRRK